MQKAFRRVCVCVFMLPLQNNRGMSGHGKAITNMAKGKLNSQSEAKKERNAPLNENIILINSSYQKRPCHGWLEVAGCVCI